MATSLLCILILSVSRVDRAPENPAARGVGGGVRGPSNYRIKKFVVAFFGLGSVPLPEGNIPDPCDEIWE